MSVKETHYKIKGKIGKFKPLKGTIPNLDKKANDLKAWQDGTLVNDKALKRLSLKELNEINDMLSRAGY